MPKPLVKPTLLDKLLGLPAWLRQGRIDLDAMQQRRQTAAYRQRLQRAKVLWIGAGLCMALNPELPFILLVGLIATLLSFAMLDEAD